MFVRDCDNKDVCVPSASTVDDSLVMIYDQSLRDLEASSSSRSHSVKHSMGNASARDTEGTRYLQPGTWTEEFKIYQCDRKARGIQPASWTTWWRTWLKNWKSKLQHRDQHFAHKKCEHCIKYKTVLKQVSSFESLEFWSSHYLRHLMSQHCDRQAYYHERLQSLNTSRGQLIGLCSTLCIIIDAMGMASFKVPRHLPGSKVLSDASRPQLHVIGVIAHGFHKAGYLFDPTIPKDANVFIEIIMITISRTKQHCRDKGLDFPARIIIVADNAGDNKNTWTFTMNAALAGSGLARMSSHVSLRTGHSHEDIDAMFGYWANCLVNQPTLETPSDFKDALLKQFPNTLFDILPGVRDWKDFFNAALIKFEGMGSSLKAAHSYCFIKRSNLPPDMYGAATSDFVDPASPHDVLLLVRKYIHSPELSQPPLVVLPASRVAILKSQKRMPPFLPRLVYSKSQIADLEKTAKKLEEFPFRLVRAATYLRSLADCSADEKDRSVSLIADVSLFPVLRDPIASAIVAWQAPPNMIEPPQVVKLIQGATRMPRSWHLSYHAECSV